MDSFLDLLAAIRQHLGWYLERASFQRFVSFTHGYFMAREQLGVAGEAEDLMNGFDEWTQLRHQATPAHGFIGLIEAESLPDDCALNRFFELLDDFLIERKARGAAAIHADLKDLRRKQLDEDQ